MWREEKETGIRHIKYVSYFFIAVNVTTFADVPKYCNLQHTKKIPPVTIYTDGSSLGNPGPGGYGIVMLAPPAHRKELSEGFKLTTNNRMELMAVCVALETLKFAPCDVTLYSDSKYVVDSVEKRWVYGWIKKGFKDKKNKDLWLRFLSVYEKHNVRLVWIKGHAQIPENERCDALAVAAANGQNLQEDKGYIDSLDSVSEQIL